MKQISSLCLAGALLFPFTTFAQSGTLDNSFGINGKRIENLGVAGFELVAIAQQPDGKILAGGYAQFNTTGFDLVLARFTATGAFDNSFGINGMVTTNTSGNSYEEMVAMTLLPNGNILVAGSGSNNVLVRYTANGSLDNSFDGDGILFITNPSDFYITDMAVQSDGKIILLGEGGWSPPQLMIQRLSASGQPDATFDSDGLVTWSYNDELIYSGTMALQPDGKILVGALVEEEDSGYTYFTTIRFTSAGAVDNTFANGQGFTSVNPGAEADELMQILVQPDGKILLGGYGYRDDGSMMYTTLVRYTSTGTLDLAFHSTGIRTISFESTGFFSLGRLVADGDKVVLSGVWRNPSGMYSFALLRLLNNGTNDNTFGTNGIAVTSAANYSQLGVLVARQSNGNYLAAGYVSNGKVYSAALLRLLPTGAVDATFDSDGLVEFMMSNQSGADRATVVHVFPDDSFLIGGEYSTGLDNYGFLKKYNPDGTPDLSFGTDGRVNLPSSFSVQLSGLVVLSAGHIVVLGSYFDILSGQDLVLYRLNSNGTPDNTFGTNGKVVLGIGNLTNDYALSLASQSDGRLIVLAVRATSSSAVLYLLRFNGNGSLDAGFGTNGLRQVPDLNTEWNDYTGTAHMLLVQPNDYIVVVGGVEGSSSNNVGLRRFTSGGDPDGTFNGGNVVSTDLGGTEYGVAVALQPDGKLVVAAHTFQYTYGQKTAVLRYLSNGTPDNSFNNNGFRILSPTSPLIGYPAAVSIQPDQKILMGGTVFNTNFNSFMVVARLHENATMDSSFGAYGVAILPNTADGYDFTKDMRLQTTGKILLCGHIMTGGQEDALIVRLNNTVATGINEVPNGLDPLQLSPNPVQDQLWLKAGTWPAGRYTLQVTTTDGRLVERRTIVVNGNSQQQSVATGHWPTGVLLVTITGSNSQKTFRVVKQ